MSRERYEVYNFKQDKLDIIDKANAILMDEDVMTVRGLYYQFIGRNWLPESWIDKKYNEEKGLPPDTVNTVKNYKRLANIIAEARMAGLVGWEKIRDELREVVTWKEFDSIKQPVEDAAEGFRLRRWADQDNYVELWVEKNALGIYAEPIAGEMHVPFMQNRGYSSVSAKRESALRLIEGANQPESLYWDDGKPVRKPVIIYVGDHDPSGEDMVRDIAESMETFGVVDLTVYKAALTLEQIRRHKLPSNPAKTSDSRVKQYVEEHGDRSWEVEALRPDLLRRYIRESFAQFVDQDKMDAMKRRESRQREKLQELVDNALADMDDDDE